jgi:hypothetical protein
MQEVPVRCYKQEPIKKSKSEKLTQKSSSKTDNNKKKKKKMELHSTITALVMMI